MKSTAKAVRNPLGSLTFGTRIVRTEEYILLAEAAKDNGVDSPLHIHLGIEAIDDMLQIMRMDSINNAYRFTKTGRLRKNHAIVDMIEQRIEILINDLKTIKEDECSD